MKRIGWLAGVTLVGAGLLLLSAVIVSAGPGPGTGIAGSAHDFSAQSWNTSSQVCKVCHTPHTANTGVTAAPLWNRKLTTATFTLYSSATLNATVAQPNGISKLCLSCHDGTVGLEAFGSQNASLDAWTDPTGTTNLIDAGRKVGTDLSNDHPISFTFDSALVTADAGLKDPATLTGVVLYAGKMECASCHDVHNAPVKTAASPLLRVTSVGSALCLKCHNK